MRIPLTVVIATAITFVAPKVVDQLQQFANSLPRMLDNLSAWTVTHFDVALPSDWKHYVQSSSVRDSVGDASGPLRDIATAVEMHESTVSRVTSNKYIATPRGIFELKYFFTTSIGAVGGGESHSSEAVRHRIRQLIGAEPPDGILSDDQIVTVLRREGVDIARRTVAKYREAMHIPNSVGRRRVKAVPA